MARDPRIRASDADRERTARALQEHHATGRLTMEEFQERLDRAYTAKTLGDLDELMADLPEEDLYQLPVPAGERGLAARQAGRLSPGWRAAWGSWATVNLVCLTIWAIIAVTGGGLQGLWFLWVAGPWGAVLLGRWLTGQAPRGHGGSRGGPRGGSSGGSRGHRGHGRHLGHGGGGGELGR